MSTIITYEDWWKWESRRRTERPYSRPSQYTVKRAVCKHTERKNRDGQACDDCIKQSAIYDKVIIRRGK